MDPRVKLTLRIIDEHDASTAFGLAETSRLMGLSEAHLMRLFHRDVGKTFRQHLLEVRMSRAAQMLKQPSLPIKHVASTCGYNDVSNFYRDFKRVYGVTPRELRFVTLTDIAHSLDRIAPLIDS